MRNFLGGLALAVVILFAASAGHAAPGDAQVTYVITNGGVDMKDKGQVHFVAHGDHAGATVTWSNSGEPADLPAGDYDVHVNFADGAATKDFWIDNQTFSGTVLKKVEMNLPIAEVTYLITNGGADVGDKGQAHFYVAGNHDTTVDWIRSGGASRLPAGTYDVHVTFADGAANKDLWLDNQSFAGKVSKKVEIGMPIAEVTYLITNGGADTGDKGQAHFYVAGNHDTSVDWVRSGGTSRLPAGTYDVHVTFLDGAANKDLWLDNQAFSGKVSKTVEVGVNVAEVTYHITNGGADTGDKGQAHFYAAGHHDTTVDWIRSGGTSRLPTGTYDVHVTFADGQAKKDLWINNQAFAGKVDKTVEMGVAIADVTYVVTNFGTDLKDKAQVHFVVAGNHAGETIDWISSGGSSRLAAGAYDAHVTYDDGMVHKQLWLDKQSFSGTVKKTVDLKIVFTQPTVSVTQNGADVGDKAVVDYLDTTDNTDFGTVKSGQTAQLEQGTYDIHAWLGAADGWLRKVALSGKPHLTIAVVAPKTETLTAGAPPPKACTIEVYGVNFDFNKATLRPDSEPVLKAVLALFTATPSFSAEVSGHTDNIGTPAYNQTLSDARAAAVKAWLVQHGIAAGRVTSRGYGDTRPLVPNTTDANRFKNRRVELRRPNCK